MEKSAVKKGDYIYEKNNELIFINLMKTNENPLYFIQINQGGNFVGKDNDSGIYGRKELRYATPFEKFWLDECIKIGEFIGRDEIEKRFNEEIHYEVY